jgi:hypothetical protein
MLNGFAVNSYPLNGVPPPCRAALNARVLNGFAVNGCRKTAPAIAELGEATATLGAALYATGSVSATLQCEILLRGQAVATLGIDADALPFPAVADLGIGLYAGGGPSAPLQVAASFGAGEAIAALAIDGYRAAKAAADLEARLYGAPSPTAASQTWTVAVTLGGVPISHITGTIEVEAEEGAARIARVSVLGPPDRDVVGAEVRIEVSAASGSGRIFTGVLNEPEYDPNTRLTTYHCTDRLKETLNAATQAQIAAAIPAYWSADLFDATASGWQHAQDRLSTIAASYELDGAGTGEPHHLEPRLPLHPARRAAAVLFLAAHLHLLRFPAPGPPVPERADAAIGR